MTADLLCTKQQSLSSRKNVTLCLAHQHGISMCASA